MFQLLSARRETKFSISCLQQLDCVHKCCGREVNKIRSENTFSDAIVCRFDRSSVCRNLFLLFAKRKKKNFANEKLMFEPIKVVFEIARSFLLLLLVVREEIKIRNKKKTKVIHERGNKATYSFKL